MPLTVDPKVVMIHSSRSHLDEVGESYLEHQGVAFRYGFNCLKASLMAFVHGVVPGLFQTSASDIVNKLASNRRVSE